MNNFYFLLDHIKKRPIMFLGSTSLRGLYAFLQGYAHARNELSVGMTNEEKHFEGFQDWLEKRYNHINIGIWLDMIISRTKNDEDALSVFFSLLEEYKNEVKLENIDS